MSDITSFNQLFVEAARRSLRLNRLDQDQNGVWRANWRVDGEKTWFGPVAEHARPFDAAHNAYVLADLQAPVPGSHGSHELDEDAAKLMTMGQDPGPTDADLFG